jgi:hypothetical protein
MRANNIGLYKKITEHPLMDSGAPIARRSGRVPKHNRAKSIAGEKIRWQYVYSWAYTQKNSAIASRATSIGSTERAPNEDE